MEGVPLLDAKKPAPLGDEIEVDLAAAQQHPPHLVDGRDLVGLSRGCGGTTTEKPKSSRAETASLWRGGDLRRGKKRLAEVAAHLAAQRVEKCVEGVVGTITCQLSSALSWG